MRSLKIENIFLLLHYLGSVNGFNCYIGRDEDYQVSSCFSCQLLNKVDFNTGIYGSRSPSVRNYDGKALSRLPTYSDDRLGEARHDRGLQLGDDEPSRLDRQLQYSQPSTLIPRILFPTTHAPTSQVSSVPMLRECWPNPYKAESPGCSVQKYRGQWYNICRCDTELCNDAPAKLGSLLMPTIIIILHQVFYY